MNILKIYKYRTIVITYNLYFNKFYLKYVLNIYKT